MDYVFLSFLFLLYIFFSIDSMLHIFLCLCFLNSYILYEKRPQQALLSSGYFQGIARFILFVKLVILLLITSGPSSLVSDV